MIFLGVPRRRVVASGVRKVSPRQVNSQPSPFLPSLLNDVFFQIEGGIPSICTAWSSLETALMVHYTTR